MVFVPTLELSIFAQRTSHIATPTLPALLFNSLEFAVFLIIVWVLYWKVFQRKLVQQNAFLVVVSYLFYGWWDYRFLGLIFLSSLVDYFVSQRIYGTDNKTHKKRWLWVSISINLGILIFFKYFNFFADSFESLLGYFGLHADPFTLTILLPVGISFYTFQTLSYTVDVYRGQLEPETSPVNFFAFVSFFPQLVAGPIERASRLLPQFRKSRTFDYQTSVDGLRQMLWGFVKKVVIADSFAPSVEYIFDHHGELGGAALFLGGMFFLIQVYGDFSGYSDIALGTAKLFGFRLMVNFDKPFFSQNFTEVWRRWHISLGSWFRDYVYIPLGGNRHGRFRKTLYLSLTLILMAFWHGASWNMILWGVILCIYQLPNFYFTRIRARYQIQNLYLLRAVQGVRIVLTFLLFGYSLIIFRATSFWGGIHHYVRIFQSADWWVIPEELQGNYHGWFFLGLIVFEALTFKQEHPLVLTRVPRPLRWLLYIGLSWLVVSYFDHQASFIYFQF